MSLSVKRLCTGTHSLFHRGAFRFLQRYNENTSKSLKVYTLIYESGSLDVPCKSIHPLKRHLYQLFQVVFLLQPSLPFTLLSNGHLCFLKESSEHGPDTPATSNTAVSSFKCKFCIYKRVW